MNSKIGLMLAVLGMLFQSLNADITTGLTLYYPLNGNALDASGNANDGTLVGVTATTDRNGNANSAYSFDGTNNNSIILGTKGKSYDNFSFGGWHKTDKTITIYGESTGGTQYWGQNYSIGPDQCGTDSGAGISVGTNGIQVYEHGNAYLPVLASYSGNIGTGWNHIFVVYNGKQPTIYLNGSPVKTGLTSVRPKVWTSTSVGPIPPNASYGPYGGSIDEIRIYNRSLSASDVKELYDSEKPQDTSLVAYYPFNGNANDESGNGNNGTIANASLATDRFGKANSAIMITTDYGGANTVNNIPISGNADRTIGKSPCRC